MAPSTTRSVLVVMPLAEQRGGAELALLHLLQHGQAQGIEWKVAFLEDGPMVQQARQFGAEAHVIEAGRLRQLGRYQATVRRLATLARRCRADLVLSWMGKGQLYGGPAAKLAGTRAAWFQMGLADGWMDRLATRLPTTAVFACSEFSARLQSRLKPRRRVVPLQLGAELNSFEPRRSPHGEAPLPELSPPVIGIVGRLQTWKGMHVLIEAMPKVHRRHPNATCLIVGGEHKLEPDYPQRLAAQVERLGLQDQVLFAGHQTNIPQWMSAMDVIVHASDQEPFGIVVVEAMAMGKPVIATIPGGPAEVIREAVDGQLVRFGDSDALAAAMVRYLDDPAFAAKCGENAANRARDFSAKAFAQRACEAVIDVANPEPMGQTWVSSGTARKAPA